MKRVKRGIIAILVVSGLAFVYGSGLYHQLNLKNLQSLQLDLTQFQNANLSLVAFGYFLGYLLYCLIGVPGITVLNVFGGVLLGFELGSILSIVAVSLGSLGSFLIARFLFRSFIHRKFAGKLHSIERHLKEEGSLFLFSLRLVPVIPYSILNFIFGLSPMRSSSFFVATFLGLLPMTFLYNYLGHEASAQFQTIHSVTELISWKIVVGLCLIAAFPYLGKKYVLPILRNKRRLPHAE